MKCPICLLDKCEADFFGKDTCYKCIYKQKTEGNKNRHKALLCLICNNAIESTRLKYCSEICAKKAMKTQCKEYWTWNLKVEKVAWD